MKQEKAKEAAEILKSISQLNDVINDWIPKIEFSGNNYQNFYSATGIDLQEEEKKVRLKITKIVKAKLLSEQQRLERL